MKRGRMSRKFLSAAALGESRPHKAGTFRPVVGALGLRRTPQSFGCNRALLSRTILIFESVSSLKQPMKKVP